MPEDDDAALRARLEALELEVRAETAATRAAQTQKDAALSRLREQRAAKDSEKQALVRRQAEIVSTRRGATDPRATGRGQLDDVETAMALARKARGMREELTKPRGAHEKSVLASGALSLFLGPVGWLYAGSFREAVPATAAYLLLGAILTKLPFMFLFMLPLMIALGLSGIAGLVYAMQFNRHGKRQRLFNKEAKGGDPKVLTSARRALLEDDK